MFCVHKYINLKLHVYLLQIFKCHKLILSVASVVFEKAFFGDTRFKESDAPRDNPIPLKDVSTETFECAMRLDSPSTQISISIEKS